MKLREQIIRRSGLLLAVCLAAAVFLPAVRTEAASKKTVYVVTECTSKDGTERYKYEYNSEGLVAKRISGTDETASITEFYYNSKGLLKKTVEKDEILEEDNTSTFTYNEKNLLVKWVKKDNRTKKTLESAVLEYDSQGRISKIVDTIYKQGKTPKKVITCKPAYKKGLISKITFTIKGSSDKEVFEFRYNDQKMISKQIFSWGTETEKYTYNKSGRITKRTVTMTGTNGGKTKTVYTYKYKKMTVPKSRAALINEQQGGFLGTRWSFFY